MVRDTSKRPNRPATLSERGSNGLRAVRPTRRGPARLAPLAVLPVFADLRGRPALVVGGGEGAAWKAELLAAAGARVRLLLGGDAAARPDGGSFCEEAVALVGRVGSSTPGSAPASDRFGTVELVARPWEPSDLTGRAAPDATRTAPDRPALALIDTECHAEAAAFAAIARSAGVTVNAIDKPVHGDVTFGSIVNRSPVVVGVSTDGAAPILGQAIRRRIETMLPPSLAEWARAMRTARARVLAMLPERPARRRFFELFSDAALRQTFPPDATPVGASAPNGHDRTIPAEADGDPIIAMAHLASRPSVERGPGVAANRHDGTGHVALVGSGPGPAEWLTLAAVRALQGADVVLHDALVSDEVLELARREAKRMLVGKRAGRESCRQEDINALMLRLAGSSPDGGKRVVRLKSGDPMVFGRAGDEIEALAAAGIPHEVVPGITAAQGLAASLGLSLTHRAHARSVRFVTGHGASGELPADLDWRGLADPTTTLVVYMGARTAPLIAERLIREGLASDTPVIVASDIARPERTAWRGTLETLQDAPLPPDRPTLIAIGDAMRPAKVGITEGTRRPNAA